MGYIDYLNAFNRWREKTVPSDKAIVLYIGLLDLFNQRRWPEWTGIDRLRLLMLARTSEKRVAYRARDELAEAGLIEYRSFGVKGRATEYRLLELGVEKSSPDPPRKSSPNLPPYPTPPNKIKTKTEKKTSFSGGGGKAPGPAEGSVVADFITEQGDSLDSFLGVTEDVRSEVEKTAQELFQAYTSRLPTQADLAHVLSFITSLDGFGKRSVSKDRKELLIYAFQQSNWAGKPGDWRYIAGIMGNVYRRGHTTVEAAQDYDDKRAGI